MRRPFSLEPNKEYEFIVGQNDRYLIMRNLTSDIVLRSDTFESDLTLSRSDTVTVETLERVKMKFVNTSDVVISGEFQLSPVEIRIKEQQMNIDGAVVVSEIAEPVTVNEISSPVTVKEVQLPVAITGPVEVSGIKETVSVSVEEVKKPVEVIQSAVFNGIQTKKIRSMEILSGKYLYLSVQASKKNKGNYSIFGIELEAGDYFEIKVPFDADKTMQKYIRPLENGDTAIINFIKSE
ncbi:hypothetical protein [Photobacterium damselae]|uniref:hypothetical protein n=1 Tax=Photobacterium damselae TaxID=38293 RepID=UPI001EFDDF4C|nr:hypothetical protein [Photobacterium damselae]MCG9779490.1 hypothetical protein [Photobacterium damselae]